MHQAARLVYQNNESSYVCCNMKTRLDGAPLNILARKLLKWNFQEGGGPITQ